VDHLAGPLLAGGELLEDVERAGLLGRVGLPAAPGAVVVVEVLPAALLEEVVAAPDQENSLTRSAIASAYHRRPVRANPIELW